MRSVSGFNIWKRFSVSPEDDKWTFQRVLGGLLEVVQVSLQTMKAMLPDVPMNENQEKLMHLSDAVYSAQAAVEKIQQQLEILE